MVQLGSSARYKRIRRKFGVIAGCIGICKDQVLLTLATNRRSNPVVASCKQKKLQCRDVCRRVKGIARVMLQSISSTRNKRARRWCDGTVECTGIHEAVLSPTLVVNRRNNPVPVISTRKKLLCRDKCRQAQGIAHVSCCDQAP